MRDLSPALIALGVVLCFVSAFAGALLALAIDDPDVVVTERVVEVAQVPLDLSPLPESFSALRAEYVERTGVDDEWTSVIVEEIAAGVCNGHDPISVVAEHYESDPAIVLRGSDLVEFMGLVESACRPG